MHPVYLKNIDVSKKKLPYIIAEIGVNHEGSMSKAKHLIDLCSSAGAHAAKFQTYISYGKPIFSFPGNILEEIIIKHNIGFILSKNTFKKVIYKFIKMPKTKEKKINKNCELLFKENFELKKNTFNLEEFIRKNIIK